MECQPTHCSLIVAKVYRDTGRFLRFRQRAYHGVGDCFCRADPLVGPAYGDSCITWSPPTMPAENGCSGEMGSGGHRKPLCAPLPGEAMAMAAGLVLADPSMGGSVALLSSSMSPPRSMCLGGKVGATVGIGGSSAFGPRGRGTRWRAADDAAESTCGWMGGGTGEWIALGLPRLLATLGARGLIHAPDWLRLGNGSGVSTPGRRSVPQPADGDWPQPEVPPGGHGGKRCWRIGLSAGSWVGPSGVCVGWCGGMAAPLRTILSPWGTASGCWKACAFACPAGC